METPVNTPVTTKATYTAKERRQGCLHFALRFQSLFGFLVIFIIAALVSPVRDGRNIFLGSENLLNVVRFASENGIIAVGMTLVILTGGIDLSVGAILALCAVGTASGLMQHNLGTPLIVIVVLALGTTIGVLNGVITTRLGIQSFITTLAMMSAARGVASLWSGGIAIPLAFPSGPVNGEPGLFSLVSNASKSGMAPASYKSLFAGEVHIFGLSLPVQAFYFIAVGLIATFLLKRTGFGRHVYAVGANETAARLSGVNVNRVKVIVFGISGLLSGLAALLHAALVNQGSHIEGQGYELNAIAAVVIGGTSLMGGVGTVAGSMIGALILSILDNILGLRNTPADYQLILKGAIIVFAVVLQRQQR